MESISARIGDKQSEALQKMRKSLVANCNTSKSDETRVCTPISEIAQLLKSALSSSVATIGSLMLDTHRSWAEVVAAKVKRIRVEMYIALLRG